MAAIVNIFEWNGASGAEVATSKTSGTIRFKSADNATVDAVNPLVKPSGVSLYRSFEKWLRLGIGGTGPTGEISNLNFYTDGASAWTGITLYARTTNPGVYATPVTPANDVAGTNAFTYTSGSPKPLDVANPGPFTGTNVAIGDFLVMWMTLDSTVPGPQNPTASETMSFSYDET